MNTLQTGVTLTLTKAEVSLLINSLENDVDMMSHSEVPDYTDVGLMQYYLTRASTLRMLKELT